MINRHHWFHFWIDFFSILDTAGNKKWEPKCCGWCTLLPNTSPDVFIPLPDLSSSPPPPALWQEKVVGPYLVCGALGSSDTCRPIKPSLICTRTTLNISHLQKSQTTVIFTFQPPSSFSSYHESIEGKLYLYPVKNKNNLNCPYICFANAIEVRVDILFTFEPEKFNLYFVTRENFDWLANKSATKGSFTPQSLQLEK